MLTGFEEITQELTNFEKEQALPLIVAGLRSKVGKANSVTGSIIIEKVNESKRLGSYKLNGARLRKIINVIRKENHLSGVLSSSKGYYVAETLEEYERCLESLKQRLREQQLIVDCLEVQVEAFMEEKAEAEAEALYELRKRFDG